jgi:hypothetical protein
MAALPPMMPWVQAPADWKSAVKLMMAAAAMAMAARVPARVWQGSGSLVVGCRAGDGGEFASAEGASGLEACCGGEVGGEWHPSSCGICLSLAKMAAWLLDRFASLTVFAHLREGGAGCGAASSKATSQPTPPSSLYLVPASWRWPGVQACVLQEGRRW